MPGFLMIVPMGDASQHRNMWLDDGEHRCFDILAMYFGSDDNFECPECVAVFRAKDAKWHLLHLLAVSQLWQDIKGRYSVFMVPDDDLLMSTHVINTAFQAFLHFNLQLGQPAVCQHRDSTTMQRLMLREPGSGLRYTAFVEIMAPMFSAKVMDELIMPNLNDSYTGYGLDSAWPRMLGFPKDRVGVIDAVCMFHPAYQAPNRRRVYNNPHPRGWSTWDEERETMRRFGVTWAARHAAGIKDKQELHVWSSIPEAQFWAEFQTKQCKGGNNPMPSSIREVAASSTSQTSAMAAQGMLAIQVLIDIAALWLALRRWAGPGWQATVSLAGKAAVLRPGWTGWKKLATEE